MSRRKKVVRLVGQSGKTQYDLTFFLSVRGGFAIEAVCDWESLERGSHEEPVVYIIHDPAMMRERQDFAASIHGMNRDHKVIVWAEEMSLDKSQLSGCWDRWFDSRESRGSLVNAVKVLSERKRGPKKSVGTVPRGSIKAALEW
jgi:hypothetical protein